MAVLRSRTKTQRYQNDTDIAEEKDALGLDVNETVVGRDYKTNGYPWPYRMKGIILFTFLHIGGIIGLFCLHKIKLLTWIYGTYIVPVSFSFNKTFTCLSSRTRQWNHTFPHVFKTLYKISSLTLLMIDGGNRSIMEGESNISMTNFS